MEKAVVDRIVKMVGPHHREARDGMERSAGQAIYLGTYRIPEGHGETLKMLS